MTTAPFSLEDDNKGCLLLLATPASRLVNATWSETLSEVEFPLDSLMSRARSSVYSSVMSSPFAKKAISRVSMCSPQSEYSPLSIRENLRTWHLFH